MSMGTEQEAKFWVPALSAFQVFLESRGARLLAPRVLEHNIRFDTPWGGLQREGRVLRLRRGHTQSLGYKGRAQVYQGVVTREEIEVEVSDLEAVRQILLALGFVEVFVYEKYRTLYRWRESWLALDETPMGNFVEIEAPSVEAVHRIAQALALDLEAAVATSYVGLFQNLKAHYRLPFRDLTFANFADLPQLDLRALGLRPAWQPG